jgi:hypothetical protein
MGLGIALATGALGKMFKRFADDLDETEDTLVR